MSPATSHRWPLAAAVPGLDRGPQFHDELDQVEDTQDRPSQIPVTQLRPSQPVTQALLAQRSPLHAASFQDRPPQPAAVVEAVSVGGVVVVVPDDVTQPALFQALPLQLSVVFVLVQAVPRSAAGAQTAGSQARPTMFRSPTRVTLLWVT